MIEPGTLIDGRYVVERTLASGGMGTVVLVRHQTLDSLHALKILHVPGKDIRERLLMEGRVQAKLKHPNIVAVTDTLLVDGSPGIVMEYVDGGSLEDLLLQQQLPWTEAEQVFLGILAGMHHAHDAGLVHRDLKPANVLLARLGEGILPKVADFGIVKVLAEAQEKTLGYAPTRTGIGMGTPQYMAPEQADGASEVGPEADVFSLGCILYELTCGRRPFEAKSMLGILAGAADGMFDDPEDVNPDLPKPVVEAIRGALVPDRHHRIQSCVELARIMTAGRVRSLSGVPQSHSGKPTDTVPLGRYPRGLGSIEKHRGSGRNSTWSGSRPPSESSVPPPSQPPVAHSAPPPEKGGRGGLIAAVVALSILLIGVLALGGLTIAGLAGVAGAAWWATADTGTATAETDGGTTDPGDTDTPATDTDTDTDTDSAGPDTDDPKTPVEPPTTPTKPPVNTTTTTTNPPENTGGTSTAGTTTKPPENTGGTGTTTASGTATTATTKPPDNTGGTSEPEWTLVVTGKRFEQRVKRSMFTHETEKGHLLVIDVRVTNNSSKAVDAIAPWRLRYGTRFFEPSSKCDLALSNRAGLAMEVARGRSATGTLCFDLPKRTTSGVLEFRPISGGAPTATARI